MSLIIVNTIIKYQVLNHLVKMSESKTPHYIQQRYLCLGKMTCMNSAVNVAVNKSIKKTPLEFHRGMQ